MTNPIISKFLADNSAYIDEDTAAALSSLNDTAWPALVEALDEINSGATEPGIDCAIAVTHETLADFDHSRMTFWSERGSRSEHMVGGFKAVKYDRFQLRRGDTRRSQIIIDLGNIRAALV